MLKKILCFNFYSFLPFFSSELLRPCFLLQYFFLIFIFIAFYLWIPSGIFFFFWNFCFYFYFSSIFLVISRTLICSLSFLNHFCFWNFFALSINLHRLRVVDFCCFRAEGCSLVKQDVVLRAHAQGLSDHVHIWANVLPADERRPRCRRKQTSQNGPTTEEERKHSVCH